MSRSDKERVADILDAAAAISNLVASGKARWDTDRIRRLAVEQRCDELVRLVDRAQMTIGDSPPTVCA